MQRFVLPLFLLSVTACTQVKASPARNFITVESPLVALTDARVIDGTGAPGRASQTVIIRDGLIAAVGDATAVEVPAGAHIIDVRGKTVLPGWVMVHEHMFFSDGIKGVPAPNTFPVLYLAGGATTIRTGGAMSWRRERVLKDMIENGELPGPEIDVTSPFIERSFLKILQFESDYNRGRRLAEQWADQGATSFKAYQSVNPEQLRGVIDAAHERGLKVTGHLCATTYAEAAALGIDNLEHGLWGATDFVSDKRPGECPESTKIQAVYDADWPAIRRLIQTLVARRVAITSTLAVFETFLPGRSPATEAALNLMSQDARDRYTRHRGEIDANPKQRNWGKMFEKEMAFERAFVKAGGLLLAGTDPTGHGGLVAGFSNMRQVQLLVEAGFSVPEAIRIATLNGATYLGRQDRIGSITVGKQADLIIVRGNPEDRISSIEEIDLIFKKGNGYDPVKLREATRGLVGVR